MLKYIIILELLSKDSIDQYYTFKGIGNNKREYTIFTNNHKRVGDTLLVNISKKHTKNNK